MSSSLLFAAAIISTTFIHTHSIHVMKDDSGHIDMAVELDIGADITTLYMRCYLTNVWFGIAINQDAHNSSTPTMAVIYNANGEGKLHDIALSDDYSIPTLLPSQWTLTSVITLGSTTSIILTRPNIISSDSRYPDFTVCDAFYDLNTIWAHGTSSTFTDHTPSNRIVATLRRQTPYTPPPDLDYTSLPTLATITCPVSSTCTTFNDNKACCQQNIDCQWKDTDTCNYEEGTDICCTEITVNPTANPTANPTGIPTPSPTFEPTPNPTCPRDPNDSLDDDPCTGYTRDCCKFYADQCVWNRIDSACYTFTTTTSTTTTTTTSITTTSTTKSTDIPTTDPTDRATVEPTPSPTCPEYPQDSDDGDGCGGFSRECCINSIECTWSQSVFCAEEGGQTEDGGECCYAITESPTNQPTPEPTTTTTTLKPTLSPVCADSDSDDNDGCLGLDFECCPVANGQCKWGQSDLCNDDGPNCCYPVTGSPTPKPTPKPVTLQPVYTPTTQSPTTMEPTTKPSKSPTNKPTEYPSSNPTLSPTKKPTDDESEEDELEYIEPCECDEGVTSMTLRYVGKRTAKKVIIYYDNENQEKKTICKYQYVKYGQELVCDVTKSKNAKNMGYQFTDITYFAIKYETYDDSGSSDRRRLASDDSAEDEESEKSFCAGSIDTNCRRDIVGDVGTDCTDLMVIAWTDLEDETCDERSTRNMYPGMIDADTFVTDNKSADILAKGLMVLAGLLSIVAILCMVKCLKKMDRHFFRANSERYTFEGTSMMAEASERERKTTQFTETIDGDDRHDDGENLRETEDMVIEISSFELK